jgi:hypothetical protein
MFVTFEKNTFCKKSIVMQKMSHPILHFTNQEQMDFLFQRFFIMCASKWIGMFQTHVVIIGWWILCRENNVEFSNIFQV